MKLRIEPPGPLQNLDTLSIKKKEKWQKTYAKLTEKWQKGDKKFLIALKDAVQGGTSTYNQILMSNPHAIHTYGRVLKQVQDLVDSGNPQFAP